MWRAIGVGGLLTVLLTAGCGGPASSSGPTSPPSSAGVTVGSTAPGSGADAATATTINLKQGDFPAGWQAQPNPVTAPANLDGERELYACLGAPPPDSHMTANVNSSTFVLEQQQASSNVKFTPSDAQSSGDYSVLSKPAFADCARRVLLTTLPRALPAGSSVASSSASALPATAPVGERVTASVVTANVDMQGSRTTVYAEFLSILRGRAVVGVQTVGLGQPFPAGLQQSMVSAVEARADQVPV